MAPMVDMVFLLLVFFMCVTAVSGGRARMKLDLPETVTGKAAGAGSAGAASATGGTGAATQAPQLVLSLSARGELSLNGVMLAPDALPATLRRLRAESGTGVAPQVRIRAEASVPYRQIQTLLLACSQAGIDKISYAAHEAQLQLQPGSSQSIPATDVSHVSLPAAFASAAGSREAAASGASVAPAGRPLAGGEGGAL